MERDDAGQALDTALPTTTFLDRVGGALEPRGFHRDNSLVVLSLCRDELVQPFVRLVEQRWGSTFSIGGLGGLPAGDATGWSACLSHVPDRQRGKLLAIGLSHIGTESDGSSGTYHRLGMCESEPACGAVRAVLASWNDEGTGEETTDHELHVLRTALGEKGSRPVNMLEATMATADAVLERMIEGIRAHDPFGRMDVAVVAGVQVHVPGGGGGQDRILVTGAGLLTADGFEELDI